MTCSVACRGHLQELLLLLLAGRGKGLPQCRTESSRWRRCHSSGQHRVAPAKARCQRQRWMMPPCARLQ